MTGIHGILAATFRAPELALEKDESRPLAEAVANVAQYYDVPGLDDKALAWVGLIMVAGKVYAPRAILISMRLKEEGKNKPPKGQVMTFRPRPREVPKEPPQPAPVEPTPQEAKLSPVESVHLTMPNSEFDFAG